MYEFYHLLYALSSMLLAFLNLRFKLKYRAMYEFSRCNEEIFDIIAFLKNRNE